jgi:hypothetical protein
MSTTYLAVTNDTERQLAVVEAVTGATTLTAEDSGKVFILKAAAGAQITLPAVATSAGLRFKFIVGQLFATTDWTVKAATNVIEGSVLVNGAHVAGVDENTISFVASAESIGDFAELVCDGTNWYVNGSGVTAGAITLTAV